MLKKGDFGSQVCEFDLSPEFIFGPNLGINEISSINESENEESTNNLLILSNIIRSLNKELSEQERTIELQNEQIKILKETIKDLERKHSFDRAYEDKIGPYSDHLKSSICRLISQIPKLASEGEGLISIILSLLLLSPPELAEIQLIRTSKNPRNIMCLFGDRRY
jgi:uncharacterized coiled-coil protein SlyX